jgi:hypothetical protein
VCTDDTFGLTCNRTHISSYILDEADSMFRTPERSQKMECAFDQLMGLKPSLKIMISATLVPVLLIMKEQGEKDIDMLVIEPSDDYLGIDQMHHLKGANGDVVLLEHNDLSYKEGYPFGDKIIPYTNEAVKMLYDDALSGGNQKKGILVLDCTDPRVHVEGNVYTKAKLVQDMYLAEGKRIVVVVYVGKGLSRRCPGGAWEEFASGVQVGEVLENIDGDDDLGLETPVFVFGFSKMCRGASFRSTRRVPTHFVMILGKAYSNESVIQTLGRATFRGKETLKNNGFDHVTILMPKADFAMALAYQTCILEIQTRIDSGMSFDDAVNGAEFKLPDAANFKRHSPRKVGEWAGKRLNSFLSHDAFEETDELVPGEEYKIGKYWNEPTAQRCFGVLLRLTRKSKQEWFNTMDIAEAYNDTFLGSFSISKTEANKEMKEFCDDGLVDKEAGMVVKGACQWKVPRRKALTKFINGDLAYSSSDRRQCKKGKSYSSSDRAKKRAKKSPAYSGRDHQENKQARTVQIRYKYKRGPFRFASVLRQRRRWTSIISIFSFFAIFASFHSSLLYYIPTLLRLTH